jgi:hypothetical protein
MKTGEEIREGEAAPAKAREALILRVTDSEFQRRVLEQLGRLEAKMDMLVGDGQPGRMTVAEGRINVLERSEVRRSVYDRVVNAAITVAISMAIALHDHLGIR